MNTFLFKNTNGLESVATWKVIAAASASVSAAGILVASSAEMSATTCIPTWIKKIHTQLIWAKIEASLYFFKLHLTENQRSRPHQKTCRLQHRLFWAGEILLYPLDTCHHTCFKLSDSRHSILKILDPVPNKVMLTNYAVHNLICKAGYFQTRHLVLRFHWKWKADRYLVSLFSKAIAALRCSPKTSGRSSSGSWST